VAIIYIDKLGRRYILLRLIPFIAVTLLILAAGLGINGLPETDHAQGKNKNLTSLSFWEVDHLSRYSSLSGVLLDLSGSHPMDGQFRDLPAAFEGGREQYSNHSQLGVKLRGVSGLLASDYYCHWPGAHLCLHFSVLCGHMVLRVPTLTRD
jgi:hypothetical protein